MGAQQRHAKQKATNARPPTPPRRAEPGTGGTFPAWYIREPAARPRTSVDTEACVVAGNGCYTMLDRGTFNKQVNDGVVTHLKIVSEKNTARRARRREPADQPVQRLHRQPRQDPRRDPKPNVAAATPLRRLPRLARASRQALLRLPDRARPGLPAGRVPGADARRARCRRRRRRNDAIDARRHGASTASRRRRDRAACRSSCSSRPTTARRGQNVGGAGRHRRRRQASRVRPGDRRPRSTGSTTPALPASAYNEFSPTTQDLGVRHGDRRPEPTRRRADATPAPTPSREGHEEADRHARSRSAAAASRCASPEGSTVKLVIERRVAQGQEVSYSKVQTVTLKSTDAREDPPGTHRTLKAGQLPRPDHRDRPRR